MFDDDVYILYYFFHYKVHQEKCGFPKSAYTKVVNILEDKKISYCSKNDNELRDFKRQNRYDRYVERGRKVMMIEERKKNILEEARDLEEDEIDTLLEIIERYICER